MRQKFFSTVVFAVVLLLAPSPEAMASEGYDPLHTMLALNMATVSINRILSTQDRIVLDQEYENIMNNLSLGNIRSDSDITELYRKIMDIISRKRLHTEEAELLQSRYDSKMKDRLSNALATVPNLLISAGAKFSGNPYDLIGTLAASGIC